MRSLQKSGGPAANMTQEELQEWLRSDPEEFNDMMRRAMAEDTGTRWLNENGMFVFNASSPARFWARWMDMTMVRSAGKIRCPTLVTAGAADHLDPGAIQAQALYDNLACEKELMVFSDEYGAGSHCQFGAFGQSFAGKFDWLDGKMGIRT
jgi:pimeloyl-ACP methyl ester carboxylesterase